MSAGRSSTQSLIVTSDDPFLDADLCKLCRDFFNDFIAHQTPKDNADVRHIEPPWPHSLQSTRDFANAECRLCSLVLHNAAPFLLEDTTRSAPCVGRPPRDLEVRLEWIEGLQFDLQISAHAGLLKDCAQNLPANGDQHKRVLMARIQPLPGETSPRPSFDIARHFTDASRSECSRTAVVPNIDSYTGSSGTFARVRNWLEQCSRHLACTRWETSSGLAFTPPKRLIKIDGDGAHPQLRLITPGRSQPDLQYATLSHCWGGHVPVMLRQHLLESFTAQIPWAIVPKTFQDAITVTRAVGLRHIWIDALCIVQDSITDWSCEAAKMASVYAHAELNISANDSSSPTDGLFRHRDLRRITWFPLESTTASGESRNWMCYADTTDTDISQAPIHSRAWVVQEYFLARRIVYFGRDQVHWECACTIASEALPPDLELDYPCGDFIGKGYLSTIRESIDLSAKMTKLYEFWGYTVQTFTTCNLTVISDKPVAISGIARVICQQLGLRPHDYLCGLWRPRLLQNLMWRSSQWCGIWKDQLNPKCRRLADSSVPSWSWLSVMGDVCFEDLSDDVMSMNRWRAISVAEIVEAECTLAGLDPFGPVQGGHVKLWSLLIPGILSRQTVVPEDRSYNLQGVRGFELKLTTLPNADLLALKIYLDDGAAHELPGSEGEQSVHLLMMFIIVSAKSAAEGIQNDPAGYVTISVNDCIIND